MKPQRKMTWARTSRLCFGALMMVLLGTLPSIASASIEAPKQAQATQGQAFVQEHARRFQGTLLAGYGGYYLRRVPTRRLENDLYRINSSIQKYTHLNAPHMPSMLGPVLLLVGGGLTMAGGLVAFALYIASFGRGFPIFSVVLAVGGAALIAGIIWLIINATKRRRTPYYKKLRRLHILRKAIIIELRNRTGRRYGLRLPPVHGQQFAFAF